MKLTTLRIIVLATGLLAGALGVSWILLFETPFGNAARVVDFPINPGSGSARIARELEEEGLVGNSTMFRLYIRVMGLERKLKAGYYELKSGSSISEIADRLVEGKVRMTTFTVPEGWHNRQIAEMLESRGFVSSRQDFLDETRRSDILDRYGIPGESTEGYLFPDTYTIPENYPVAKIHEAMLKRFFQVLKEIHAPLDLSPMDLEQKVILASIIEREAAKPEELPAMAGVFQNRIDQGMKLESCATVQYLLPKPRQKLYERDLQIHSPYNTYLNRGFPPGPISNPGRKALEAVFSPLKSNNLFFVLKPDGSHHFSSTYGEHLRAKRQFLDRMEGY